MPPLRFVATFAALVSLTLPLATRAQPPREQDAVETLDVLDQAVVDLLGGRTRLFGFLTPAERKERLADLEAALDDGLASAAAARPMARGETGRLAGLHVGVLYRRLVGNQPVRTAVAAVWDRPECRTDLALGRWWARYARAQAAGDEGEQFLTLMEYQNGLNCLGEVEARLLAEGAGLALWRWMDAVEAAGWSEERVERGIAAVLNPALLLFDLTKSQGHTWLYYWLHRVKGASRGALGHVRHVYLYDFVTGSLASFVPLGFLELDRLIDPRHIGTGACSLMEMTGSGTATGEFGCARGLECVRTGLDGLDLPVVVDLPAPTPANPGLVPVARPTSHDALAGPRTPYGIPHRSLRGQCDGAGSGAAGLGQLAGSPSLSSFAGCLSAALAAAVAEGVPACVLSAARAGMDEQPTPILGEGPGGLPVVRGVLGGSRCATDPLADGPPQPLPSPGGAGCSTFFTCAQEKAAAFLRSAEGREYTRQLLHDAVDAWAGELRQFQQMHTAGGDDSLTPVQAAQVAAGHALAESSADSFAEQGAEAIENAEQTEDLAVEKGDVGQTDGDDIEVDAGMETTGSNQATLEHEGAHVIMNLFGVPSRGRHHDVMKQQADTYYGRWGTWMEEITDWFQEQNQEAQERRTKRTEEQDENGDPPDPEDPALMPEPDKDPCTAMSESLRAALACTTPIFEPFEFPDPPTGPVFHDLRSRLGETFLTPLPDTGDRPTGEAEAASRFGHCYDQFGFDVLGVDSNGRLVVGAARDPGAAQCGDIDCAPPATARSVGGQCRCVGPEPDGRLLRDLGRLRLCQTSDACFPRDEFFEVLDRALTEIP